MGRLFGTDGIRGKFGEYPITAEFAYELGLGLAGMLGDGGGRCTVVIGRDTRESGVILEKAVATGLCDGGADVVLAGVLPTPATALSVMHFAAQAAVMITASHNPFNDNGLKIFGADGYKFSDEREEELEQLLLGDEVLCKVSDRGGIKAVEGEISYYERSLEESVCGVDLRGLKVVLDAGNGAGSLVGRRVLEGLGAEVVSIGAVPDGRNINDTCGALYPEIAAKAVLENRAALGISLDGDADRVILSDENGVVVSGDQALAMCARFLKAEGLLAKDTLVTTVMSNLGLDESLSEEGIRVVRAGVGDRQVLKLMREEGYTFGGENSGHLIFAEYARTGDGILSALQVCKMMSVSGKSLGELRGGLVEYPSELVNVPVSRKPALKDLPKLTKQLARADETFGSEGRYLVRYSGTEDKLRILVEHKSEEVMREWMGILVKTVEEEIG